MLIRINPTEPEVPKSKGYGLRMGNLDSLRRLREAPIERAT